MKVYTQHRSVLALVWSLFFILPATAQTTNIDSLTRVLQQLPDGYEKMEVLSSLFTFYLNADLKKARSYSDQMLALGQKTGNELALATAWKDIGVTHMIASNADSAMHYYRLAEQKFGKLMRQNKGAGKSKILEGYAASIANIGNWHYYQSSPDSAIQYHLRAIEFSDQSGIEKVKANSLGVLSFIYMDQARPDEALALQFDALKIFEKSGNLDGISRSYQTIGEINCAYLKKCDLALDYYHKALLLKKRLGSERGMAYVFRKTGDAYDQMGMLDSAGYYYEKTIGLAEKLADKRLLVGGYSALVSVWNQSNKPLQQRMDLCLRLIEAAKEAGDSEALYVGYNYLATVYEQQGNYELAISYYEQALPLAKEQKDYDFLQKVNYELYTLYNSHLRNPAKAMIALEEYVVYHDSVANAERFRAVEDISTRYETEKKEATIAEQQEDLQRERTRFWFIVLILSVVLIATVALYRLTRILRRRNAEKEFLVKEIHHRVKNNLQVLSSLLHLQARHIKDDAALDAVREGQNRVEAMGLIHQKLYMGDRLAAVEMRDYLDNLGEILLDSFGIDPERVRLVYHVEPIRLDVDTAIPIGLIFNELITNSLKYAFPEARTGVIEIELKKTDTGKLRLSVTDNGVGKAAAAALRRSTSFGSNLVQILSKKLKGVPQTPEVQQGHATWIEFGEYKVV